MRPSKALTVKRVFFRRGAITLGILITGIFSIILAILAWFGANTGNFIVLLGKEGFQKGIILSEQKDFSTEEPRLYATIPEGVEFDNITFTDININDVKQTDGYFFDEEYSTLFLGYTYYLKNNGESVVDITYRIEITEVYRNADEAIRVMLIEDDEIERIFQKADDPPQVYIGIPETINFVDEKTVYVGTITDFKPGDVKKFSVIIWLEGQDNDCIDDLQRGMVKIRMRFDIDEDE